MAGTNGNGTNGSANGNGKSNGNGGPSQQKPAPFQDDPKRRFRWSAEEWLEVYRATGDAGRAAKAVGIARKTAELRMRTEPAFGAAYKEAKAERFLMLEESVANRCLLGVVDDDIQCVREVRTIDKKSGTSTVEREFAKVGEKHRFPDVLTIFWMKARRPDVYSERAMNNGAGGGPDEEQLQSKVDLRLLSPEGREALRVFLIEQQKAQRLAILEEAGPTPDQQ